MKAKRMAAILLAAALTIPCWNLAAQAAFSDVPSNAWPLKNPAFSKALVTEGFPRTAT